MVVLRPCIKNTSEIQGTETPNNVIKFLVEEGPVGQLALLLNEKLAELDLLHKFAQTTHLHFFFLLYFFFFIFHFPIFPEETNKSLKDY